VLPLKLGTDEQFSQLRSILENCGYTEQAICERTGIARIQQFTSIHEGREDHLHITDPLDALIRLLLDCETVALPDLVRHLPAGAVEVLTELDVARPVDGDPAILASTASVYPVAGVFIASDRVFLVGSAKLSLPEDVVYAAITHNTGRFLSFIPADPCGTLLDLCTGSGVAALAGAAKYARHAWASDLGARSVHFSEFNRRLNGLSNVSAVLGDLYAAVPGLTFDRILAHPPYVPAEEQKLLFRDGGEDGEQIFRRVVEGLPSALNPGGRAYILTRATDREGAPLEQRIRQWLGPSHGDFDVLLAIHEEEPGPDEAERIMRSRSDRPVKLARGGELYKRLKVTGLLYVLVIVQRHREPRTPVTARNHKARTAASLEIEWFRSWYARNSDPDFPEFLCSAHPRPSERFRLEVHHAFRDGVLGAIEFLVKVDHPFPTCASVEPWVAYLFGYCDGKRNTREVLAELRGAEVVAPDYSEAQFLEILSRFIAEGLLEIPECPLPVHPGQPTED
jgi:methylase of polypeptide subunit release factors